MKQTDPAALVEFEQKHEVMQTVQRTLVAWLGTVAGLSLQDVLQILVLFVTLVFTLINIYITVRDKILRRETVKIERGI